MSNFKKFITGSRYRGASNTALKCMEGYGTYVYPDGSEYRGYFKNGRFHGYGRLKLKAGESYLVKGRFNRGELVDVQEIIFDDGLRYKGNPEETSDGDNEEKGGTGSEKWRFLSETDRRFAPEISNGLDAVGPMTHLSRKRPERLLPRGCYDKEEGIYKPNSGFLTDIPKPFAPSRFVSCPSETRWIIDNCRRGQGFTQDMCNDLEALEPEPEVGRKIIDANVNAMKTLSRVAQSCACNEMVAREHYLTKMCKEKNVALSKASSDESLPLTPSTSDQESFVPDVLVEAVKENTERELQSMINFAMSDSDSESSGLMEYRVSAFNVRDSRASRTSRHTTGLLRAADSVAVKKIQFGFKKLKVVDLD